MKIGPNMALREVALIVCTAIDRIGTTAVLTGGSAATIYAPNEYQSCDIDFVLDFTIPTRDAAKELEALGFFLQNSSYAHPDNPFTLDFVRGPIQIGEEVVDVWSTLNDGDKILHLLTPTDSIRDRLSAFLFWDDHQSLEVALSIARSQSDHIDLNALRSWIEREGEIEKGNEFFRRLALKK